MVAERNIRSLKAFLLIILLVIFFSLFFFQVVIQYTGKYTNFYKISKTGDRIEIPTFTICTGCYYQARERAFASHGLYIQFYHNLKITREM